MPTKENCPAPTVNSAEVEKPGIRHMCSSVAFLWVYDVDLGPRGLCVVAATNKFTGTAEVLLRKRDGIAIL